MLTFRLIVPGWSKMTDYAKANFGTGSYNLATNPSDFPDQTANTCAQLTPVSVTPNGPPDCTNNTMHTQGKDSGTSGIVELQITSGFSITSSNSVTSEYLACFPYLSGELIPSLNRNFVADRRGFVRNRNDF